ncbi:transmembrane protein 106B-like [Mugil cephalus]|uniref:transmembrane protein 106B-like n=1 Tax=Mugil cephalus TaxID=48193 RepID=UPI001FB7A5ED|nr:transmembrane protein 106B-like [Mugil cephalus]
MGSVAGKRYGLIRGLSSQNGGSGQDGDCEHIIESDDNRKQGPSVVDSSGDSVNCPTCQGTGRIPRGQEGKLVAVIPCNDQRLKPRHTKLYVALSVGLCLLTSALVLFFLFPRSVLLSPVAVQSSFVYFHNTSVEINIMNVLNITNDNFVEVKAYNLTVQALNYNSVVGSTTVKDVASIKALSVHTLKYVIPINVTDPAMSDYCKKATIPVHILFLHLQMSMTVYYLAHYEQLSLETFEYIDCGRNSTKPHNVQPPPT